MTKSHLPYTLQIALAIGLCIAGMVLLFCSFWVPPRGEIHSSVLTAYGEVMTFVGALVGMDYNYRKHRSRSKEDKL